MKGVAVLIAAGAVAAGTVGGQAAASSGCQPTGKTLARDAAAVVYAAGGSVYGCAERIGTPFKLGTSGFCNGANRIDHIALAGELAAYGIDRCGVDTGSATINVHRLTDNQALIPAQAAITGQVGPESYESVGSLVLRPDGAVAWIAKAISIIGHGPTPIEVHRVDGHGRRRVLDSGAGIALGSLRVDGQRLTWRHGRATRHATLR